MAADFPDPAGSSDPESSVVELDELLVRPGTYFNPQTEMVVIVDDSPSIDQEIFNMEDYEGADWVRISEEVPVDENALDMTLEAFQTTYHPVSREPATEAPLEADDPPDDEPDAPDELED